MEWLDQEKKKFLSKVTPFPHLCWCGMHGKVNSLLAVYFL